MNFLTDDSPRRSAERVRIHSSTAWAVQLVYGIFLAVGGAGLFSDSDIGSKMFFAIVAVFGLVGVVRAGVMGAEVRGGRVITRTSLVTRTYEDVVRLDVEEGPISGGRVDGSYVVLCLADGRRIELKEQLSTYRWAERRRRTVTKQAHRLAQALNVPGPGNGDGPYQSGQVRN